MVFSSTCCASERFEARSETGKVGLSHEKRICGRGFTSCFSCIFCSTFCLNSEENPSLSNEPEAGAQSTLAHAQTCADFFQVACSSLFNKSEEV